MLVCRHRRVPGRHCLPRPTEASMIQTLSNLNGGRRVATTPLPSLFGTPGAVSVCVWHKGGAPESCPQSTSLAHPLLAISKGAWTVCNKAMVKALQSLSGEWAQSSKCAVVAYIAGAKRGSTHQRQL